MRKQIRILVIKFKILIASHRLSLSYGDLNGVWIALSRMLEIEELKKEMNK